MPDWSKARKWRKRDGGKRPDESAHASDRSPFDVCEWCGKIVCVMQWVVGEFCDGVHLCRDCVVSGEGWRKME